MQRSFNCFLGRTNSVQKRSGEVEVPGVARKKSKEVRMTAVSYMKELVPREGPKALGQSTSLSLSDSYLKLRRRRKVVWTT